MAHNKTSDQISYTTAINEEMLRSATTNAKRKATRAENKQFSQYCFPAYQRRDLFKYAENKCRKVHRTMLPRFRAVPLGII